MMLKSAYQSDVGRVRAVNEDRAIVQHDLGGLSLAVVADGMGGHQAGDIASEMAVDFIQKELRSLNASASVEERRQRLKQAVEAANRHIFEYASKREQYHGMGTTIVAILADDTSVVVAHIGDSRAYRIRSGQLEQLTEDHSLVNELLRSGQITYEEAEHHPRRNVLTRALGTEPTIEVDVREIEWTAGDILLLCSDGLSGLVGREQLAAVVSGEGDLQHKVELLIQKALDAGGDDNVTVVLLGHEPADSVHNEEEAR